MDLREVGYDDRDWINLAQDRDRWRAYRFRERHCDDTPLAGQRQIQMERILTPVMKEWGLWEIGSKGNAQLPLRATMCSRTLSGKSVKLVEHEYPQQHRQLIPLHSTASLAQLLSRRKKTPSPKTSPRCLPVLRSSANAKAYVASQIYVRSVLQSNGLHLHLHLSCHAHRRETGRLPNAWREALDTTAWRVSSAVTGEKENVFGENFHRPPQIKIDNSKIWGPWWPMNVTTATDPSLKCYVLFNDARNCRGYISVTDVPEFYNDITEVVDSEGALTVSSATEEAGTAEFVKSELAKATGVAQSVKVLACRSEVALRRGFDSLELITWLDFFRGSPQS
ncbi:hypothetical protein ANN_00887 [Periplaneta americana]|uniref:Uncharacterized protein n=1 Tax=Periplaneta americana TaxID=6978 RepID=A0ABQ8TS08_PERAM|nr:hypothetical protein ANN_00887 [Periplaneta americana]